MDKPILNSEKELQDALINKILIASTLVIITAYSGTLLRALGLGWSSRDTFQFLAVCGILTLTAMRRKLTTNIKVLLLIIAYSIGSIAGIYTLGLLAGTLFIFAAVTVIIAVFYTSRTTWAYSISFLIFFGVVGYMFCTGMTSIPKSADYLMTNFSHWMVYFLCVYFFITVVSITIYNYRNSMELMIDTITSQRDELTKKNAELKVALGEIKTLSGFLPICASCKKIRDDKGYWQQIETYVAEHSYAEFSHSICQDCAKIMYHDLVDENGNFTDH